MHDIIVISGATSGIGKELKKLYEQNGDVVINLSRSASGENSYPVDVRNTTAVKDAVNSVLQKYGRIDTVIANAGLGLSGATELISEEEVRYQFDVNFFGAVELVKACLAGMKRGGKVAFISSACAIFPLPYRAYYCASKSALTSVSEGLYMELKPLGIKVCCICPGDIKTNFTSNRVKNSDGGRYGCAPSLAASKIDSREDKRMNVTSASKKIFKACLTCKKPFVIIGAKYKFLNFLSHILPRRLMLNATRKLFG